METNKFDITIEIITIVALVTAIILTLTNVYDCMYIATGWAIGHAIYHIIDIKVNKKEKLHHVNITYDECYGDDDLDDSKNS